MIRFVMDQFSNEIVSSMSSREKRHYHRVERCLPRTFIGRYKASGVHDR
ncbi:hypothetical protein [Teredinibacter purpureus]|nr:hypothetical protein [Teredinibacter purpureus]